MEPTGTAPALVMPEDAVTEGAAYCRLADHPCRMIGEDDPRHRLSGHQVAENNEASGIRMRMDGLAPHKSIMHQYISISTYSVLS